MENMYSDNHRDCDTDNNGCRSALVMYRLSNSLFHIYHFSSNLVNHHPLQVLSSREWHPGGMDLYGHSDKVPVAPQSVFNSSRHSSAFGVVVTTSSDHETQRQRGSWDGK